MANAVTQSILVVGGGMAGMTAALEAAETGYDVFLVEKNPYLGGRVAQLHQYFPKLCPPYCGLEINFKRIRQNPKIRVYTLAEVEKISGHKGDFDVTITIQPRYVDESSAAGADFEAASMITTKIDNPFNFGMDKVKAVYLPHDLAYPLRHVVDPDYAKNPAAAKLLNVFPSFGFDFTQKPETVEIKVGAVVWATGWEPYDPFKLEAYNFGKNPDVITNVMMERLAAANGPTSGKIVRPSDGKAPKSVAFIQCAGSRDENHLGFCSGICCLASLKQATYVRAQYPDAEIYIFFIDIRAKDRLEDFYRMVKEDKKVHFFKGKVAQIEPAPVGGGVIMKVENTATQELSLVQVDLAVLATGMQPGTKGRPIPIDAKVHYDGYGFIAADSGVPGLIGAGCVRTPVGVSETVTDGTAAALKAIQSIRGGN